jgi:hypothetical protein
MALNMDAIGKKIGPMKKDYTWKDAVLYAIGVGAGFDELDYTYEKNLKVIPSFSIAAIFDFLGEVAAASNMNLAGILHGEQELIFHNSIPPSGTLHERHHGLRTAGRRIRRRKRPPEHRRISCKGTGFLDRRRPFAEPTADLPALRRRLPAPRRS